jgi:hypothetical protein
MIHQPVEFFVICLHCIGWQVLEYGFSCRENISILNESPYCVYIGGQQLNFFEYSWPVLITRPIEDIVNEEDELKRTIFGEY